nr:IK cytokine down-regulator of HLA II [Hymenolepis microstoma]CUU98068.1 IK cytokine down-regulator of HLA II [Hymenolepis microstoma]
MSMNWDTISNPQPPPQDESAPKQVPLSNSDFRKLLLTTESQKTHRDASNATAPRTRSDRPKSHSSKSRPPKSRPHLRKHRREDGDGDESRKSDKAPKYRDRARERREGKISSNMESLDSTIHEEAVEARDDEEEDPNRLIHTADYRAVAPTTGADHAAERMRAIEESKYLGGDMENTHLVKGLDYALLKKMRRQIRSMELQADQELDKELEKPLGEDIIRREGTLETGLNFKTRMAEKIIETLFKSNQGNVERNEYFQPGRMAYRVELEDEMAEFEVPATVIRSKADCPLLDETTSSNSNLSTDDIIINKLAQIFAYTRAGRRQAKKAKMTKQKTDGPDYETHASRQDEPKPKPKPIFDDAPSEYVPTKSRSSHRDRESESSSHRHRDRNRDESSSSTSKRYQSSSSSARYFEKPVIEPEDKAATSKSAISATKDFVQQLSSKFNTSSAAKATDEQANLERLLKKTEISGYDECYPGFAESYDAMGDSDEETDFSKMDMGNKKGPMGRWDFETQEEYGDYMSNREALPKAAYQYGVKKPEGRKTRRIGGSGGGAGSNQKEERAKVDRQLQQITSLINKRKQMAQVVVDSESKRMKY